MPKQPFGSYLRIWIEDEVDAHDENHHERILDMLSLMSEEKIKTVLKEYNA